GGGERVARADRHLPQPLGHLLRPLPQARLRNARGVSERLAGTLCRGGIARLVAQLLEVDELLGAAAELLLAALEVPEVEEVPARQEPLVTQEREDLLAQEDRPQARLGLGELGLFAQMLEQRVIPEGLEQRPVEHRGG